MLTLVDYFHYVSMIKSAYLFYLFLLYLFQQFAFIVIN